MLLRYASPNVFHDASQRLAPWAAGGAVALFVAGVVIGLGFSPPDYQQGDTVRIMYVHVPAAWMALFCYSCLAMASAATLVWRHPLSDMVARSTAPIGACFTFLALVTGSLWGRPMWGAWWVWDARLTSVLILFFLYLGYIALANAFDDPNRGTRSAAVLALVGFVNVPIIKFSVDWWNTLHQPASLLRLEGPTIDAAMLTPLLLMALAYSAFYVWMLLVRVRGEILESRIRAIRLDRTGA